MKVGVAKEIAPGERRVALIPETADKLRGAKLTVLVERGAGAGALVATAVGLTGAASCGLGCGATGVEAVRTGVARFGFAAISVLLPRNKPAKAYSLKLSGTGVTAPRMVAGSAPSATATGNFSPGYFCLNS